MKVIFIAHESRKVKTGPIVFATSVDLDQPWLPRSLIEIHDVRQ